MKNTIILSIIIYFFANNAVSQPRTFNLNDENAFHPGWISSSEVKAKDFGLLSIVKARPFDINPKLLEPGNPKVGDNILLQLFEDKTYMSRISSITTDINGVVSILAQLPDYQGASCVITLSHGSFSVNIAIPTSNEKYSTRMLPRERRVHLIAFDANDLDILPGGPPIISEPDKTTIEKEINRPLRKKRNLNCRL